MRTSVVLSVVLLFSALLGTGCAFDKTGRSGSYLLRSTMDNTRDRARAVEQDLAVERQRLDDMEQRASAARKRLADSGATLETFLEELTRVRGELANMQQAYRDSGRFQDDMDQRLTWVEVRLAHMERELDVAPPPLPVPLPVPSRTEDVPKGPPSDSGGPGDRVDSGGSAAARVESDDSSSRAVGSSPTEAPADIVVQDDVVVEGPEDKQFEEALLLVKEGQWDKAGGKLQRFLRKNPDSDWAVEAQYLVGQCLFELGRFKGAITEFQKVIDKEDPDGKMGRRAKWSPKAMFMQGLAFVELGTPEDVEAAKVFLAEVERLYPRSDEASRARRKLEQL